MGSSYSTCKVTDRDLPPLSLKLYHVDLQLPYEGHYTLYVSFKQKKYYTPYMKGRKISSAIQIAYELTEADLTSNTRLDICVSQYGMAGAQLYAQIPLRCFLTKHFRGATLAEDIPIDSHLTYGQEACGYIKLYAETTSSESFQLLLQNEYTKFLAIDNLLALSKTNKSKFKSYVTPELLEAFTELTLTVSGDESGVLELPDEEVEQPVEYYEDTRARLLSMWQGLVEMDMPLRTFLMKQGLLAQLSKLLSTRDIEIRLMVLNALKSFVATHSLQKKVADHFILDQVMLLLQPHIHDVLFVSALNLVCYFDDYPQLEESLPDLVRQLAVRAETANTSILIRILTFLKGLPAQHQSLISQHPFFRLALRTIETENAVFNRSHDTLLQLWLDLWKKMLPGSLETLKTTPELIDYLHLFLLRSSVRCETLRLLHQLLREGHYTLQVDHFGYFYDILNDPDNNTQLAAFDFFLYLTQEHWALLLEMDVLRSFLMSLHKVDDSLKQSTWTTKLIEWIKAFPNHALLLQAGLMTVLELCICHLQHHTPKKQYYFRAIVHEILKVYESKEDQKLMELHRLDYPNLSAEYKTLVKPYVEPAFTPDGQIEPPPPTPSFWSSVKSYTSRWNPFG